MPPALKLLQVFKERFWSKPRDCL